MANKSYDEMTVAELILAGAAEAVEIAEGRMKAPRRLWIVTPRHAQAAEAGPERHSDDAGGEVPA